MVLVLTCCSLYSVINKETPRFILCRETGLSSESRAAHCPRSSRVSAGRRIMLPCRTTLRKGAH